MTARELLNTLSEMDVTLKLTATGNIAIDGPSGSLTPDVIEFVRLEKQELIILLGGEASVAEGAVGGGRWQDEPLAPDIEDEFANGDEPATDEPKHDVSEGRVKERF